MAIMPMSPSSTGSWGQLGWAGWAGLGAAETPPNWATAPSPSTRRTLNPRSGVIAAVSHCCGAGCCIGAQADTGSWGNHPLQYPGQRFSRISVLTSVYKLQRRLMLLLLLSLNGLCMENTFLRKIFVQDDAELCWTVCNLSFQQGEKLQQREKA